MDDTSRNPSSAANMALVAILLLGVYVGSYYGLVRPSFSIETYPGIYGAAADYSAAPAIARPIFWPMNQIDRLIRPGIWKPFSW